MNPRTTFVIEYSRSYSGSPSKTRLEIYNLMRKAPLKRTLHFVVLAEIPPRRNDRPEDVEPLVFCALALPEGSRAAVCVRVGGAVSLPLHQVVVASVMTATRPYNSCLGSIVSRGLAQVPDLTVSAQRRRSGT